MKYLILSVLALIIIRPARASILNDYKWKKRVIVLKGDPGSKAFHSAFNKIEEAKESLLERDVVILKEKAPDFEIELFGKDGGKKWSSDEDFEIKEITSLIDSMPMRQEEMRGNQ